MQEDGEDIRLRIPEGVALVPLARETLGGDIAPAVAPGGLEEMEEVKAKPLQKGIVPPDLKADAVPEGIERGRLLFEEGVEGGGPAAGVDRILPECGAFPMARRGVADALFKMQALPRPQALLCFPEGAVFGRAGAARDAPVLECAADRKAAVLGLLLHGEKTALREDPAARETAVLPGGVSGVVGVPLGDHGGGKGALQAEGAGPLQTC